MRIARKIKFNGPVRWYTGDQREQSRRRSGGIRCGDDLVIFSCSGGQDLLIFEEDYEQSFGSLFTKEQYESSKLSYAFLCGEKVVRFGQVIGKRADIEVFDETVELKRRQV